MCDISCDIYEAQRGLALSARTPPTLITPLDIHSALASSTTTLVINARSHNYAQVGGITGSDEVAYNKGDNRYYTGSSGAPKVAGSPLGRGSVLGVIDGSSVLVEAIPQSSGGHSVAVDPDRNLIFVAQTYTSAAGVFPLGDQNLTAGAGSPTVGQLICGTSNGCIAVYKSGLTSSGGAGTPTVQILDNDTGSQTTLTVGDSFTFTVSGAAPLSVVYVSETGWSSPVGYTDSTGSFHLSGTAASGVIGSWAQTWTVGGIVAQPAPLQFTINAKQ